MLTDSELFCELEGLNRFAVKLCRNPADAEDLVQSTIEKALRNREKFHDGTKAFSWLSKIMFNIFATGYKRQSKFESMYDPEPLLMNIESAPTQEDMIMVHEVQNALMKLSAPHREILILICAYEMSYEEVSDRLDIPVGTVRSRLSRARDALIQEMGGSNRKLPLDQASMTVSSILVN